MSVEEGALISEIVETHVATMREHYTCNLSDLIEHCESPIERVFSAALLHDLSVYPEFRFGVVAPEDWKPSKFLTENVVIAQCKIGHYRIDFLVVFGGKMSQLKIAIECDGHDFHERTKEQAVRDRAKDRWLQSHGYYIFRFTGSEIWKDPLGCSAQVSRLIFNKVFFG